MSASSAWRDNPSSNVNKMMAELADYHDVDITSFLMQILLLKSREREWRISEVRMFVRLQGRKCSLLKRDVKEHKVEALEWNLTRRPFLTSSVSPASTVSSFRVFPNDMPQAISAGSHGMNLSNWNPFTILRSRVESKMASSLWIEFDEQHFRSTSFVNVISGDLGLSAKTLIQRVSVAITKHTLKWKT